MEPGAITCQPCKPYGYKNQQKGKKRSGLFHGVALFSVYSSTVDGRGTAGIPGCSIELFNIGVDPVAQLFTGFEMRYVLATQNHWFTGFGITASSGLAVMQ